VSNLLAAHPDVFTPQHEQHHGQHESAYFSSLVPYCRNGRDQADRQAVRAIFERGDFWHLLFPERPPELDIEQLGLHGYFGAAMEQAASRRDCSHWLEKTPAHTVFLRELLTHFPEARFIAVQRDRLDAARSNVHRKGNPARMRLWVRAAIWGEVYRKILHANRDRLLLLDYEDLQADFTGEVRRLYAHAGLASERVHASTWAPDSSFAAEPPRVARRFVVIVRLVAWLFRALPAAWCERGAQAWMRRRRPLPPWFFRVFHGRAGD
jgi:hypothetical protein